MDVLQYSAFNQQVALRKELREETKCFRDLTHAAGGTTTGNDVKMLEWICEIEPCLRQYPYIRDTAAQNAPCYWDCIPEGAGWTGGFKVCDQSGYYRCGTNCNWTVPGGISCVRFQMWGAGGTSGGGYQCSGAVWGETGAYASVIMQVTPGWTYCMCAGCAYCCYPSEPAQGRNQGCPSWVNGCGLCAVCAEGGGGSMFNWMAAVGKGRPYRTGNVCCMDSGSCFCSQGTWYRYDNSCAICKGPIEHVGGANYNGCIWGTTANTNSTVPSDGNGIVYGIRGIWPEWCYNTNHYGWGNHPPIYGFENCTRCCFQWTSGNCCGCYCSSWFSGCLRVPGAGGWPNITMGDHRSGCGDAGGMGMVCISYK